MGFMDFLSRRTFLRGIAQASLVGPAISAEVIANALSTSEMSVDESCAVTDFIFATDEVLQLVSKTIEEHEIYGAVLRLGLTENSEGKYQAFLDIRGDDSTSADVTQIVKGVRLVADRDSLRLLKDTNIYRTAPSAGEYTLRLCGPLFCDCWKRRKGGAGMAGHIDSDATPGHAGLGAVDLDDIAVAHKRSASGGPYQTTDEVLRKLKSIRATL